MFKINFKGDFKKVETFNDGATIVTLTGRMIIPNFIEDCLPNSVWEWVNNHPSVKVLGANLTQYYCWLIKVQGKSVCAKDDTFDVKTGERIAESRAKIKLYKFMQSMTTQLCEYYYALVYGKQGKAVSNFLHPNDDSLYATNKRYTGLLDHERHHLIKLLQKTV